MQNSNLNKLFISQNLTARKVLLRYFLGEFEVLDFKKKFAISLKIVH